MTCTSRLCSWQYCLVERSHSDPIHQFSASSFQSLFPPARLLTTPLFVSSAATAYWRLCKRCENAGSLDGRSEGTEEALKVATKLVERVGGQIALERQLPDL